MLKRLPWRVVCTLLMSRTMTKAFFCANVAVTPASGAVRRDRKLQFQWNAAHSSACEREENEAARLSRGLLV